MINTVKPMNNGHLQLLKKLSVIEGCLLLGRNLKKIVTFGTKCFLRYSWNVRYLGCPLFGGFTVFLFFDVSTLKLRIIIIILPTDRLKIILSTARATKN